ncbi:MAG TPA: M1 family metallopeptidase [Bacteroidota bacterium]
MKPPFRLLIACLIVYSTSAQARQIIFSQPQSPRIANYTISVSLDAQKKMLQGKETLRWRNASNDRISELRFHLYLNAFKNSKSTFMTESGGQERGVRMEEGGWGWIDVTSMSVRDGEDLKAKMEFIHPDDDNAADQTVFRVALTKPVLPNQTITIDINFTAKMPSAFARTGYSHDYFMVGQWFPKIGVYEPAGMRYAVTGQWNCHQFHANSEFYADYGVYDVDMTVPKDFVVGATGVQQNDRDNGNGTKTYFYHAEDIHDFSWTASPLYKVVTDQWKSVSIRLLIQPDHVKGNADRYIQSVKAALEYLDKHVGKYPYPNITIVDPQWGALGSGGMEYPTLITGGSFWGIPDGLRLVENVTIHEFTHQYFYGLLGSNEFEEAWLDEGMTQYYETRIMDATYGAKTSLIDFRGFHEGDFESTRSGYTGLENPKIAPTYQRAWDYKAGGYGSMTYNKSAVFMTTLQRLIGTDVMDEAIKTYYDRWKFKHPCSKDIIAVISEVVHKHYGDKYGKDMQWYFDQVLYGTDVCDYALKSINNEMVFGTRGLVDSAGTKITPREKRDTKARTMYESRVVVDRLGEIRLPVDVLVHFSDSSEVREHWDGQARWQEFKYAGPRRVVWALVDPDNVLAIDINVNNNGKTTDPVSQPIWKYTLKFLYWMQNALQYSSLF